MLFTTTLVSGAIATKYIIGLVTGGGVAGAGISTGVFHYLSKRKKPDDVDLERVERQKAREDALDNIIEDVDERLELTIQDFKENSTEISSTINLFKEVFQDVFNKTQELGEVAQSIRENEKKRLAELEKAQKELQLKIEEVSEQLIKSEKMREELRTKLTEVGEQLLSSSTKIVEGEKEIEELRLLQEKQKKENQELADAYKESIQSNEALERQLNQAIDLLKKKQQQINSLQENLSSEKKNPHTSTFFSTQSTL
ncbi:hypothetical protein [Legionella brunensis]|uniref:Chromosome partition protein Smc n=1 Tax=Legionella brunensis TaxID=29422 RepID=A0A0W0SQD1_9GAMM|nr:hypothetical protein [Legionella brunensis]KTC85205.1 hypothetical protein Lbru_1001 [Legionella brunensis]